MGLFERHGTVERWLQKVALKLIPEDVRRGCGYGSADTGSTDPFDLVCDAHDDFFTRHAGSVVQGDRMFFADMLRVCAKTAETSINKALKQLGRCFLYLFFVRTVGVFLYWRLEAKGT